MDTTDILVLAGVTAAVAFLLYYAWSRPSRRRMPEEEPASALPPPSPTPGMFAAALARTRELFAAALARDRGDVDAMDALEEALIRADVGARASHTLVEEVRGAPDLRAALRDRVLERLRRFPVALNEGGKPYVVLVVGVNGSGKTTSIGKLAARFVREGKSVLLGAGDTFRAGAIEQLRIWGERAGVEVVAGQEGGDPAAVAHQAIEAAKARGIDVVICDTAGRLQAQKALMDELGKIRRVIGRLVPGAPHEVLLVLDATMGQNAISQARVFREVAGVTGVVLTKLDGTAKGGVVVAVAEEFGLPVKFVGLGEKIDDLRPFEPEAFVDALLPG